MNRADLIKALRDFTAPLSRRLQLLLQRGVLDRVSYKGSVRLLQVKLPGGNVLSDIEHLEPFGFTSHAPKGAETIVLALAGNGSHSLVLLVGDRRYRMKIDEGEAALYNQFGDRVHIKNNREIELKSAVKVLLDTPKTECTGELIVHGATQLRSTLSVVGSTTLADTLTVVGTADFSAYSTFAAGASVGGIDFVMHFHPYTDDGANKSTGGAQG